MNSHPRVFGTILLLFSSLAAINHADAQIAIASNSTYTANFQGKQVTHSWTLDLTEDFNDFRVQLESPVGEVLIFLVEPGQTKGTKLEPANKTSHATATTGVCGNVIEATLPKGKKLGPGRHIIKVSPLNPKQNVNKYSIKVTQPTLSETTPKEEPAPATKPAVPATPELPNSGVQGELLAELKALREEMKTLRDEMKAMEKRTTELEAAQKGR